MPSSVVSHNTSFFERMSTTGSSSRDVKVTVQLLHDEETVTAEFKRSEPAQAILDYVLAEMHVNEGDYFGLRYQDRNQNRYWVDLSKPISHMAKQFKFPETLLLRLRFRFYPNDPHLLKEEITRYQLFLQLQRDLLHGRLYCPHGTAAPLAALILQAELGDYSPDIHGEHYATQYKLLLKQTPKIEEKIEELHKEMKGKLTTAQAELEFLERAAALDTYGFDPYTVKEARDPTQAVYLGVTHRGILMYKGTTKVHSIPWSQFDKADYIGHEVRIAPTDDYQPPSAIPDMERPDFDKENEPSSSVKKKTKTIKLECPSSTYAKHLWTHILSQHAFFNEQTAAAVKPKHSKSRFPLFGRGSTFRFSSKRVLHEIEAAPTIVEEEPLQESAFFRHTLPRQAPRAEAPWLSKTTHVASLNKSFSLNGTLPRVPEEDKKSTKSGHQGSLLDEMAQMILQHSEVATHAVQTEPEEEATVRKTLESVKKDLSPTINLNNNNNIVDKPPIVEVVTTVRKDPVYAQNKAQITVRMVKYEPLTNTPPPPEEMGQPLMTSTPTSAAEETLRQRKLANGGSFEKALNGIAKTNGTLTTSSLNTSATARNKTLTLKNTVFIGLLLLLAIALFFVVFFEIQRSREAEKHWLPTTWDEERIELLTRLRLNYYEPMRGTLGRLYARLPFSRSK
ncbi:unnamed protein product, partial [Mesorhabditis spiculigera]